jgi:hypothetical protein
MKNLLTQILHYKNPTMSNQTYNLQWKRNKTTKLICSTLQNREQKVAYQTTYANAWIAPVQHIGK